LKASRSQKEPSLRFLAREGDETFELDASMEAELLESLAEAERGEIVSADEVLRDLRNSR
jgi:predicted transcriptional regulator